MLKWSITGSRSGNQLPSALEPAHTPPVPEETLQYDTEKDLMELDRVSLDIERTLSEFSQPQAPSFSTNTYYRFITPIDELPENNLGEEVILLHEIQTEQEPEVHTEQPENSPQNNPGPRVHFSEVPVIIDPAFNRPPKYSSVLSLLSRYFLHNRQKADLEAGEHNGTAGPTSAIFLERNLGLISFYTIISIGASLLIYLQPQTQVVLSARRILSLTMFTTSVIISIFSIFEFASLARQRRERKCITKFMSMAFCLIVAVLNLGACYFLFGNIFSVPKLSIWQEGEDTEFVSRISELLYFSLSQWKEYAAWAGLSIVLGPTVCFLKKSKKRLIVLLRFYCLMLYMAIIMIFITGFMATYTAKWVLENYFVDLMNTPKSSAHRLSAARMLKIIWNPAFELFFAAYYSMMFANLCQYYVLPRPLKGILKATYVLVCALASLFLVLLFYYVMEAENNIPKVLGVEIGPRTPLDVLSSGEARYHNLTRSIPE